MKLFRATIKFYDEGTNLLTDHMIITGSSHADAAKTICDYYGKDDIDIINLVVLNPENPFIILSESMCDKIESDGDI